MAFEHPRTLYVLVFVCPMCKGPAFSWRREETTVSEERLRKKAHPVNCAGKCGQGVVIMEGSQALDILSTRWPDQPQ